MMQVRIIGKSEPGGASTGWGGGRCALDLGRQVASGVPGRHGGFA